MMALAHPFARVIAASFAVAQGDAPAPTPLNDACGDDPGGLCRWVFERTDSVGFATFANWAVDRPLRILAVLVVAWILTRVVRRSVEHFKNRLLAESSARRLADLRKGAAGRLLLSDVDPRTKARTETITTVASSTLAVLVWTIAVLLILGELGISLAPLLAGAGIAGVALGFGAQSIVKDFLTGFFMLVEDQFGVGDVIDVGPVSGTVERVSLRSTVLRDVNGNVWHVPNGEISRVGNFSQLWSRAVLDIEVAYDTDLHLAQGVIQRVADELWTDPTFTLADILEPPEVWGVENLGADGIAIRVVMKTSPSQQWAVAREFRLRIKDAFDDAGIEIPFPQQTIWVNRNPSIDRPDPSTVPIVPPRRAQPGSIAPEPTPEPHDPT